MFCAVLVLMFVAAPTMSAEDAVYFSSPDRESARTKITGEVVELTGTEVRIRSPGGGERKFPADRVVEVVTKRTPEQLAGNALLAEGEYQQALSKFRAALADGNEQRGWVRREIVAQIVRCYMGLGQTTAASDAFLNLVRSDPATRSFDCIPLAWLPAQASQELQSAAQKWLKHEESNSTATATARLLGASHLLATPQRDVAVAELQRLAGNDDVRIAALAKAQLWNSRLATAAEGDLRKWSTAIEQMPELVRAGPYFVLGRALARKQRFEQAATTLLRVPILYPADRELAARSLVEAGACLQQLQQSQEAGSLYREVLDRHRASAAAAEAQTRLAALAESAKGSP
ncbi:MAG: hypothetical protein HY000_20470 [Planctomycetes bacterium]|nr:hypothetical protein [Planctomycetota bacterium]